MKTTEFNQIAAAIYDLSKSLRLLGNGNIERDPDKFPGAIEDLSISVKESGGKIADALNGIGSAIQSLADAVEDLKK